MSWLLLLGCLVVSFVFSGIEAGILSVNRVRLRHRQNRGDAAARKLAALLARPARLLVTVLMVTNLMNICALTLLSGHLARAAGKMAGYGLTLAVALPLFVFGLEMLPKALFRRFPYRALAALAEPLRLTDLLLSPLLDLGERLAALFKPRRRGEAKLFVGREDFKYLTIESERVGALTPQERRMIHNVVDFRGVVARDVMVPMERVRTVREGAAVEELLFLGHQHGIERFPVVAANGDIGGFASVFEVLLDPGAGRKVAAFQRRILAVDEFEPASQVIRKLRAARIQMALVKDRRGRPAGVVTAHDLVMRLVSTTTAPPLAGL